MNEREWIDMRRAATVEALTYAHTETKILRLTVEALESGDASKLTNLMSSQGWLKRLMEKSLEKALN